MKGWEGDGFLNKCKKASKKGVKNLQDFPEENPIPVDLI
jgi:hypothetical protein